MAGRTHQLTLIAQEAPGVFDVRCSCGDHTWTPWGEEHALEIAEMHAFEMEGQGARRLPMRGSLRPLPQPQRR